MIRHCDGNDPHLIRYMTDELGEVIVVKVETTEMSSAESLCRDVPSIIPCDCGMIFDDVGRSVIYPHEEILSKEGREQLLRILSGEAERLLRGLDGG